jgi:hypothetical protein
LCPNLPAASKRSSEAGRVREKAMRRGLLFSSPPLPHHLVVKVRKWEGERDRG